MDPLSAIGHSFLSSGRALGDIAEYEVDHRITHLLVGNRFLRRNGVDEPKRIGFIAITMPRWPANSSASV